MFFASVAFTSLIHRIAPQLLMAAIAAVMVSSVILTGFTADAQTGVIRNDYAACASCHKRIVDTYVETPMARASGPAADLVKTGVYRESNGRAEYSIHLEQGRLSLTYRQSTPALSGSRSLDYFLGSGHLGTTYLYLQNGYLLESPVAYYAAAGSLDMKPGIAPGQLAPALPVRPACLRCHMSRVQHSDAGTFNHYRGAPFLHAGIACDACHGSAVQHVATGGKAAIVNPAKLSESQRDSVCISCHLEGDVAVERAGRSAIDYVPGETISTYLSYFVFSGKDATKRGVSEVEQFNLSLCKRKSGAAMSCTSCHDPHFTPSPEQRTGFYRNKCLACHNRDGFAEKHHAEDHDCTSCHMQRNGSDNIPHVAWTDHRILRMPEALPPDVNDASINELVPIQSPGSTGRDLALAYYNASFHGKPQLQAKAYAWLKTHEVELQGDQEALDAFGTLLAGQGQFAAARSVFEKVLALDATDFTASTNLGTLLAKSGDLKQAVAYWQPAFQRNQDIPGLAENLALAQCKLGDTAGARATLETVLTYSPGIEQVRQALAVLPHCERGSR